MRNRSAVLIACSLKEAQTIRERAAFERRTISAYVLHVVLRNAALDEKLFQEYGKLRSLLDSEFTRRPTGPRTTMLLRCASQESARIRTAAKRRNMTISGFVLYALRSSWHLANAPYPFRPQGRINLIRFA
jgi:uncharacterized protein (DUF1778 family)